MRLRALLRKHKLPVDPIRDEMRDYLKAAPNGDSKMYRVTMATLTWDALSQHLNDIIWEMPTIDSMQKSIIVGDFNQMMEDMKTICDTNSLQSIEESTQKFEIMMIELGAEIKMVFPIYF